MESFLCQNYILDDETKYDEHSVLFPCLTEVSEVIYNTKNTFFGICCRKINF